MDSTTSPNNRSGGQLERRKKDIPIPSNPPVRQSLGILVDADLGGSPECHFVAGEKHRRRDCSGAGVNVA
jgi:hypothetical protein